MKMKIMNEGRRRRVSGMLLLLAFLGGCGVQKRPPLQPGESAFPQPSGYNAFSVEQEIQLGQQAAAEADAQLPELPARGPIQDYVSTLGQKLASQLPQNPYVFNFKVVNQKEINAFALPGGPVRINLGTVQAADSESELAGVIAHEISHVYLRHATRNASKQQIAQIPAAILGGILGGGAGGQLARMGLEFGLGSVFLKYSRDAESEADRTGAKIMYEAGYDPRAMVRFFEKLEGQEKGKEGSQFLSDHPNPGNRVEAVTLAISQLPPKRYIENAAEYGRIHTLAMQMKPMTAQQVAQMQQQKRGRADNISTGSITPSGNFRTLNHGAYQIQYPDNWEALGDRNSAVTIAPRAGLSQNAIAYGVVISGYQPPAQQSLSTSAQQIYQGLQQANPTMQVESGVQQLSVSGLPALAVNLRSASPLASADGNQVAERDMLVTIQRRDGTVLWLLFIAPEQQFNALSPTFRQMLESLRMG